MQMVKCQNTRPLATISYVGSQVEVRGVNSNRNQER